MYNNCYSIILKKNTRKIQAIKIFYLFLQQGLNLNKELITTSKCTIIVIIIH